MKTKIIFLIGIVVISVFGTNIVAQSAEHSGFSEVSAVSTKPIIPEEIGMNKKVLESRVQSKVLLDIDNKSAELISDGIEAIEQTQNAIVSIESEDKAMAIEYIGMAIGKLETVALRNPSMTKVPVHRVIRTDDIDADLGEIKEIKEKISKALDKNKFHIARSELEKLISEVRIETTNLPIGAYPAVLRSALLLIEKGDLDNASKSLSTLLNTLVVSKEHISLPCMRAEVMLEETLTIQPGHTDAIVNRRLLLMNAKDQMDIAYELGQVEENSVDAIKDNIESAIRALGTIKFKEKVQNSISLISATRNKYNSEGTFNS